MEYFGTNLNCAGHYFWHLDGSRLRDSKRRWDSLPFNPESYPVYGKNEIRTKGDYQFHQVNGYSILSIYGSCTDKRHGTRSVFFINELVSKEQMIVKLLNIPIARQIIEQMPFDVSFFLKVPEL